MGVAVWDHKLRKKQAETLEIKGKVHWIKKLQIMMENIAGILTVHEPEVMVIENWVGSRNSIMYLIGALVGAGPQKVVLVHPKAWTRELLGTKDSKTAKKKAMSLAKRRYWRPDTQHSADAACILEYWYNYEYKE